VRCPTRKVDARTGARIETTPHVVIVMQLPRSAQETRTQHLIRLVEDGATLAEAGREHGLGAERVRQILRGEGISLAQMPDRLERRRARRLAAHRHFGTRMEAMWRSGMEYAQIAETLELPCETVRRLIIERVPRTERLARAAAKHKARRAPDERLLHALRSAAHVLGRTPSMAAYDRLRAQGVLAGPSGRAIERRWGWAHACLLAGLTPNRRQSQIGRATYSDDDYRAALRRIAKAIGKPPTLDEYKVRRWDGEPSTHAFRLRYGGWLAARAALLPGEAHESRSPAIPVGAAAVSATALPTPDAAPLPNEDERDQHLIAQPDQATTRRAPACTIDAERDRAREMRKRNEHLIELVEQGATLAEAGRVHGLGRERVRQILEQEDISVTALPARTERRRARRLAARRHNTPAVEAMWRRGMEIDEIADALALTSGTVKQLVRACIARDERDQRRLEHVRAQRSANEPTMRALREAARLLGRTPGCTTYDRLREQGFIDGPSAGLIAYRWGGWTVACERAGLTPNTRAAHLGRPTYSEDEYRAALRRVADVLGAPPTQKQYGALRRIGEPSGAAFARRYRGWLNAREALLRAPVTAEGARSRWLASPRSRERG
jgi:hypothetical protein